MVSVGKKTVVCLECEVPFALSFQPVEGQIITCPSCEIELEIVSVEPLEVDFYLEDWDEEEDEDWDDDDDDDED